MGVIERIVSHLFIMNQKRDKIAYGHQPVCVCVLCGVADGGQLSRQKSRRQRVSTFLSGPLTGIRSVARHEDPNDTAVNYSSRSKARDFFQRIGAGRSTAPSF